MLVSLFRRHGIRDVVVSPGSRNAPLLVAFDASDDINVHVVIDERSAAFIALGISLASGMAPVGLVCTSGTAPLNYAPALAEAYYRLCPLIAVTADRPTEWIDQDDSQTIRQPGIFHNFIKGTYDIEVESDQPDKMWLSNRLINDALNMAISGRPGPVHINVRLSDPLGQIDETPTPDPFGDASRIIVRASSAVPILLTADPMMKELAQRLLPPAKVLIVAGFMEGQCLDGALRQLARMPNIIVMHEAQSNLHGQGEFIANIDATLRTATSHELADFAPDIVITMGGSITSRMLKTWLRQSSTTVHWSIGENLHSVDSFRHMELQLPFSPSTVLNSFVALIPAEENSVPTAFKSFWLNKWNQGREQSSEYAEKATWSDFSAMHAIISNFPESWNMHLSNGTAVRYAQLFDYSKASTVECNRGVSGIDGCTSTAIGSSIINKEPTVLITGDMSMQYDIGALACSFIPPSFRIIVLNNGGGGIFRFIRSTKNLDCRERCFTGPVNLPVKDLAKAYKFTYYEAFSKETLEAAWDKFISPGSKPAILNVVTDGIMSAEILTEFFKKSNV